MSTEMIPCKINGEFEIILPKHRAERPEWYTEYGWEKKRLQKMHEVITENDTIFYVGAEEGEMPALCAMWGAQVVLFEPNKLVTPNIKAIWEANNLNEPFIFEGFAANKTTNNVMLISGFDNITGDVIHDHGFKELKDPGDIPQVKIDDLPIKPTVISLDVEGSEFEVLKGAEQTLKEHKPKIFLSGHPEFMVLNYNQWLGELRKWIKDFGYTEELLDYNHEVHLYYE